MDHHILIVNNKPFVCKSINEELKEGGYDVDYCLGGRAAVNKAKEKQYDLFFVELFLPHFDGEATIRALKKISPDAQYVCFTGIYDKVLSRRRPRSIDVDGEVKFLYQPSEKKPFLETAREMLPIKYYI